MGGGDQHDYRVNAGDRWSDPSTSFVQLIDWDRLCRLISRRFENPGNNLRDAVANRPGSRFRPSSDGEFREDVGDVCGCGAATDEKGIADLPVAASWAQLYGVSLLCGIGFTMSLFIGLLAFPTPA